MCQLYPESSVENDGTLMIPFLLHLSTKYGADLLPNKNDAVSKNGGVCLSKPGEDYACRGDGGTCRGLTDSPTQSEVNIRKPLPPQTRDTPFKP